MSTTTTTEILTVDAVAPLARRSVPPSAGDVQVLRLPMVSLATLRFRIAPEVSTCADVSCLAQQAARQLARWPWQDGRRTAWFVAEQLQDLYFGGRTRGFTRSLEPYHRTPRKGLALIVAMDEAECAGIEWYCDLARLDDYRKFDVVRLRVALRDVQM